MSDATESSPGDAYKIGPDGIAPMFRMGFIEVAERRLAEKGNPVTRTELTMMVLTLDEALTRKVITPAVAEQWRTRLVKLGGIDVAAILAAGELKGSRAAPAAQSKELPPDRASERAAVVEWLRKSTNAVALSIAQKIEAGEHLK